MLRTRGSTGHTKVRLHPFQQNLYMSTIPCTSAEWLSCCICACLLRWRRSLCLNWCGKPNFSVELLSTGPIAPTPRPRPVSPVAQATWTKFQNAHDICPAECAKQSKTELN